MDRRDTLLDQAHALIDRLYIERGRWRGYPVMEARLARTLVRAFTRLARRARIEG